MQDVFLFHQLFCKNTTKVECDKFLLKYVEIKSVSRHRPKYNSKQKQQTHSVYIIRNRRGVRVQVSKQAFVNILKVGKSRIDNIVRKFNETANLPKETRGGDRKTLKFAPKQNAIIKFISSLNCVESHYCIGKSCTHYLPSNLNVTKLFEMYKRKATEDLKSNVH